MRNETTKQTGRQTGRMGGRDGGGREREGDRNKERGAHGPGHVQDKEIEDYTEDRKVGSKGRKVL